METFASKEYPGIATAVIDLSYEAFFRIEGSDGYWVVTTIAGGPESVKRDFSARTPEGAIEKAWIAVKADWDAFERSNS